MASLLIKDFPNTLHKKLKELATKHHRSMNKEAVVLLAGALEQNNAIGEFGPALKGKFSLTQEFIDQAKAKGRA